MYFEFGQVSIWPHRDVIISKMPKTARLEIETQRKIMLDKLKIRQNKSLKIIILVNDATFYLQSKFKKYF